MDDISFFASAIGLAIICSVLAFLFVGFLHLIWHGLAYAIDWIYSCPPPPSEERSSFEEYMENRRVRLKMSDAMEEAKDLSETQVPTIGHSHEFLQPILPFLTDDDELTLNDAEYTPALYVSRRGPIQCAIDDLETLKSNILKLRKLRTKQKNGGLSRKDSTELASQIKVLNQSINRILES